VDAAFGGFAACSPRYRHLVQGWEDADSITVDFHKWLNTPYDSAAIFIRKEHAALQVATFQNSNAPYLGDPLAQFNYLNFLPENSRRFRALPVWFTLMAYGKEGYRSLVERCCGLAHALATGIKGLEGFELAAPVRLNTVCFRLSSPHEQKTDALLQALARSGRLFITPTVYRGMRCLRAALVNWRTGPEDIAVAIEELKTALQKA
jgi:glutamate/tyrosine decarboxylase-like PLP-dependent enzyme